MTSGDDNTRAAWVCAIGWADNYLAEGIAVEPMKGYDLAAFRRWCEEQLYEGGTFTCDET